MRKIIALLVCQLIALHALATVFTVTSNADSGQGTLREALTLAAANSNTLQDRIIFNMADPSEAGRTITLLSQLPKISSNLVIDGSTQPGATFGKSGAKIIIQPSNPNSAYSPFLLINVDGFEMYGLYLRDFLGDLPYNSSSVIFVNNCKNIKIGAPAKGNVFSNVTRPFSSVWGYSQTPALSPNGVENITVYSNFFGFEPDGKSYRGNPVSLNGGFDISGCSGTVTIGGTDVQRNYFGGMLSSIECQGTMPADNYETVINITNNYFNYDIDGNFSPLRLAGGYQLNTIHIANADPNLLSMVMKYTIHIINNKIQYPANIIASPVSGEVVMQGNQINYDYAANPMDFFTGWVGFTSQDRVLIGGENPGESNAIYGAQLNILSRKSVLIQHNSIYCVKDHSVWVPAVSYMGTPLALPVVTITSASLTKVAGTATPLSKVELFWDDDCQYCQPLTYITTVNADATGKWQYDGAIQKGVIASATKDGFTSLFTQAAWYEGGKITHYSCTEGGSVKSTVVHDGSYQWKDMNGNIISTAPEISGLSAGTYTLRMLNGTCSSPDYTFKIFDATPQVNDNNRKIIQPSCTAKGSVTGLSLANNPAITNDAYYQGQPNIYTYKWFDVLGNVKSTSIDLTNADAGTYKLQITYNNGCTTTYGPITLTNSTGPTINPTTAIATPANCGESTGSITNVTVTGGTGTIKYIWRNAQGQQVSSAKDLLNQLPGIYTLLVADDGNCTPLASADITIPTLNGVTIDESGATASPVSCGGNGDNVGSINGIKVSGDTGSAEYMWYDEKDVYVGKTHDPYFTTIKPGKYYMRVKNGSCLSAPTKQYTIIRDVNNTDYAKYMAVPAISGTICGKSNGSILVTISAPASADIKAYRWVAKLNGQTIGGNSNSVTGLDVGVYQLYITGNNNCEKFVSEFTVGALPGLSLNTTGVQVRDDNCNQGLGSVTGLKIIPAGNPVTCKWTDATGTIMGSTADLTNLHAGTYTLNITDGTICRQTLVYTIGNNSANLNAPTVTDVQLCTAGEALLNVSGVTKGYSYRLYDDLGSATPIDAQPSGKFKITVTGNRSYYVSQFVGDCESARTEVKVVLGGLSALKLPNAISPNGDGVNDTWKLTGIESYPTANVQIYTRAGQKVFESIGYAMPFNGVYNGTPLAAGTYYYIINLNTGCSLLSGSLTVIR